MKNLNTLLCLVSLLAAVMAGPVHADESLSDSAAAEDGTVDCFYDTNRSEEACK